MPKTATCRTMGQRARRTKTALPCPPGRQLKEPHGRDAAQAKPGADQATSWSCGTPWQLPIAGVPAASLKMP